MNGNSSSIRVFFFGQLADVIQGNELFLHNITDTNQLIEQLHKDHPKLKDIKYVVSVDRCIVYANTDISIESEIALLPPFSGG